MDKLDNIGENEIRVIGTDPHGQQKSSKRNLHRYAIIVCVIIFLVVCLLLSVRRCSSASEVATITPAPKTGGEAYVEISDTIINNVSLHRFIPVNARPKLEVGVMKAIPSKYILGAMAADFGIDHEKYKVVGAFVHHGEMLSHSKSKYGFCAILKDTVVIGNDLTTSYFEQAIEEGGDFFRQYALIHKGKVVSNPPTHNDALRRSLCRLADGRICIIDTDMSVSLDSFSTALSQYKVVDAVALMGSGAAVRWAVDKAGRRFIAGADEYDFPDVVNYIVWEKEPSEAE